MTIYMLIIVAIGVITTRAGVKNGVEREVEEKNDEIYELIRKHI